MVTYNPFIDSCLSESNIQNSMLALHKENNDLTQNKNKEKITKNMLEYLVIHNSSATDVMMEPIGDIKLQPHHLHLEKCFIQQKKENNC